MKLNRRNILRAGSLALVSGGWGNAQRTADCNCARGADGSPLDVGVSELRPVIERYDVELRDLARVYALPGSNTRHGVLEKFHADQLRLLEAINFDALSQSGKVDYLLLRERLEREQKQLAAEARLEEEIAVLIPFQQTVIGLEEARRRMETLDPQKSAVAVAKMTTDIAAAKDALPGVKATPTALNRAATRLAQLRNTFRAWFNFYDLYDPKFSWWVDAEYRKADEALDAHAQLLHSTSGATGPLETGARALAVAAAPGAVAAAPKQRMAAGVAGAEAGASSGSARPSAATKSSRALALLAATPWWMRCARPSSPTHPKSSSPSPTANSLGAIKRCCEHPTKWVSAPTGRKPWRR